MLEALCCICGEKTKGNERKEDVTKYADEVKQIWNVSVLVDSPNVHPRFICMKCRVKCSNKDYLAGKFKSSQEAKLWSPHSGDCATCKCQVARGRPSKRRRVELAKRKANIYMAVTQTRPQNMRMTKCLLEFTACLWLQLATVSPRYPTQTSVLVFRSYALLFLRHSCWNFCRTASRELMFFRRMSWVTA